ncbi:MAG: TrkA family potassium uptake protein [Clostridia bacterium]|nr:TrkA family potassium uptake protein [Clostridia bacterium]
MKNILVIGMGRFGQHLCKELFELGNEIMAVDTDEIALESVSQYVAASRVADCSNPEVLSSIGVTDYDVCVVCIGNNFQNSLEITSQLKEMGAKYVVSKANRDIQAKFLLRNGADEVIYPNRDMAEKLARKVNTNHVFDYIELTGEYAIYEIPPIKAWIGKSIREANIRAEYNVNVLGTKADGQTKIMPLADHVIEDGEHLIVVATQKDIDKIVKKID